MRTQVSKASVLMVLLILAFSTFAAVSASASSLVSAPQGLGVHSPQDKDETETETTASTHSTTKSSTTSNSVIQVSTSTDTCPLWYRILWGPCTTTSTTTSSTTSDTTTERLAVGPPNDQSKFIKNSFSSEPVSGDNWNFSNPNVCGTSNINPQCEGTDVDIFSHAGIQLIDHSGGTAPFVGVAASYGTPLSLCQPTYLSFPTINSGEGVITLCFDEAIVVPRQANGTVGLTVKVSLPPGVAGQDCGLITAQLVSLTNGNLPFGVGGPFSASVTGTSGGNVVCSVTFNIDVSAITALPSQLGTKNPFAVVVHEPTTILCVASPVGLGFVTRCGARVTGNSPTGSVAWATQGSGKFSPSICKLSQGFCQVTYLPASGVSPTPVSAKYSGDTHNAQSEGIFPLTINSKPSHTIVFCSSGSLKASSSGKLTCTAKVFGFSPTGTLVWNMTGPGTVHFSSNTCTLVSKKCTVTITAGSPGEATLSASYLGDSSNLPSIATIRINVKP